VSTCKQVIFISNVNLFMLVLGALQSEQKDFHLVTEITGSNPTSDGVDNDWAGMVPLKKVPLCTPSVTDTLHSRLCLAHTVRRKSLLYSVTIMPLECRKIMFLNFSS
jgi:hypothetical protein